jgi:hypothetical protein
MPPHALLNDRARRIAQTRRIRIRDDGIGVDLNAHNVQFSREILVICGPSAITHAVKV